MRNRTNEFQEIVKAQRGSTLRPDKGKGSANVTAGKAGVDVWMREAERLSTTLTTLLQFLSQIRRPYLDLSGSSSSTFPSSSSSTTASNQTRSIDPSLGLAGFGSVRWLSDRERDEVDVQLAVGLRRCMDGVRGLEAAEQAREARLKETTSTPLTRLLHLPPPRPSQTHQLQTQHRASVLWYLNSRLAKVGNTQKSMQETRVKLVLERSGRGRLAMLEQPQGKSGGGGEKQGKGWEVGQDGVPLMYKPAPLPPSTDETPIENLLTPTQIQQYESEASALLSLHQTTLSSLQTAETSLLAISALQNQLVTHLTQQGEIVETLWEDAVVSGGKVEDGNKMLREARERNRESRIWLLVFLIGASLALLFVDYIAG